MHPGALRAYRREVIRERPAARSCHESARFRSVLRRATRSGSIRHCVLGASLLAIVTTLTVLTLVAPAASRPDHAGGSRASLRFRADPGHCGGNMMLSVSRAEAAATSFAGAWASEWNRWAAAHNVPQQISTAGCNYLSTERYYLCAVRVRSHAPASPGASCGLIV